MKKWIAWGLMVLISGELIAQNHTLQSRRKFVESSFCDDLKDRPFRPTESREINRLEKAGASNFLILVESSLYTLIQPSLTTYQADLINEGLGSILVQFSGSTAQDLKTVIKNHYTNDAIVGAVLIGNLPSAWFEMNDWWGGSSRFPMDYYYSDLDGNWSDNDLNGYFDVHTGSMAPEIYIGRIKSDNLPLSGENESRLIQDYFLRNHQFRTGGTSNENGLVYIDDHWAVDAPFHRSDMAFLYANTEMVNNFDSTTAADYKDRIRQSYDFVHVNAHSSPGTHAFYENGTTTVNRVYNSDLPSLNPTPAFYMLIACSNARFTTDDNMGSLYLLGNDYGLGVIGSTKTGSMQKFADFYKALSYNMTLGEALTYWWVRHVDTRPDALFERSWFYGVCLLGDPTLKVKTGFIPDQLTLDDAGGDGQMDAGEAADLYLTLSHPFSGMSSFTGTLSVSDSNVTVTNGSVLFSSIGGGQYQNSSPFTVQVHDTVPDRHPFYARVSLQNSNTVQIPCTLYAPVIDLVDYRIDPVNDPQYDYLVQFIIKNNGHSPESNLAFSVDGLSHVQFGPVSFSGSILAVGTMDTASAKCKVGLPAAIVKTTVTGDYSRGEESVLLGFAIYDTTFAMDTPGPFPSYTVREGFANDWRHITTGAYSGGGYYYGTEMWTYNPFANGALETPLYKITPGTLCSFRHRYDFDPEWDGGYLEVYRDGAWSHQEITGGYPFFFCNELLESYEDVPAFSGSNMSWTLCQIDLSALSGLIKFRFHVAGDGAYQPYGWAIDDFRIQSDPHSSAGNVPPSGSMSPVLYGNYPNPFNHQTMIRYSLPRKSTVVLSIHNVLGEEVVRLIDGVVSSGFHQVRWNGRNRTGEAVSGGVYLYLLKTESEQGSWQASGKMVFLK